MAKIYLALFDRRQKQLASVAKNIASKTLFAEKSCAFMQIEISSFAKIKKKEKKDRKKGKFLAHFWGIKREKVATPGLRRDGPWEGKPSTHRESKMEDLRGEVRRSSGSLSSLSLSLSFPYYHSQCHRYCCYVIGIVSIISTLVVIISITVTVTSFIGIFHDFYSSWFLFVDICCRC